MNNNKIIQYVFQKKNVQYCFKNGLSYQNILYTKLVFHVKTSQQVTTDWFQHVKKVQFGEYPISFITVLLIIHVKSLILSDSSFNHDNCLNPYVLCLMFLSKNSLFLKVNLFNFFFTDVCSFSNAVYYDKV